MTVVVISVQVLCPQDETTTGFLNPEDLTAKTILIKLRGLQNRLTLLKVVATITTSLLLGVNTMRRHVTTQVSHLTINTNREVKLSPEFSQIRTVKYSQELPVKEQVYRRVKVIPITIKVVFSVHKLQTGSRDLQALRVDTQTIKKPLAMRVSLQLQSCSTKLVPSRVLQQLPIQVKTVVNKACKRTP
jgi:hypothetical protein